MLETILALSLAALLLGAIYAAIDQSWRTAASGREEMERAQLARALIHKIELDIRAITFVPPPPAEDEETTESTTTQGTGAASPDTTSTETEEETGPNSKSIGIRGTLSKFEMSISRPRRDLLPGTSAAVAMRTSDLRQVSYSFLPTGTGTTSGLVRTEGDRMAVEVLETSGGASNMISSVQMLAPEVAAFRVRYFDGRVWSESWDSETSGRIPRAVEISISFSPPRRQPPIFSAPVSRSMDSFRTVILIPVSDPFPQDFLP